MKTLHERYESRRKQKQAIIEKLILEKFDKETMVQATRIIKSLKGLQLDVVPALAAARDLAVLDANKVVSGKSDQGLIRKMLNVFKQGDENPLVDSLAFCDALVNFFELFVPWLDANKTGDTSGTTQELVNELVDDEKTIEDLIVKGLRPEGVFASIGKTWQKKYFKNNYRQLAKEVMVSNIETIEELGKNIVNSLSNSQAVGQAAMGASEVANKNSTPTSGTQQTSTTEKTSSTGVTEPTKPANKTGQSPAEQKKAIAKAKEVYEEIENDFGDLDPETVQRVIAVLAYNDSIK